MLIFPLKKSLRPQNYSTVICVLRIKILKIIKILKRQKKIGGRGKQINHFLNNKTFKNLTMFY